MVTPTLQGEHPNQSNRFAPTVQDRFITWAKNTYHGFQAMPVSSTQQEGLGLLRDSQRRQDILFQAILIRLGSPPPASLLGQLATQAAQTLFGGGDPS